MKERKVIRNLEGFFWNKDKKGFVTSDEATFFNCYTDAYMEIFRAAVKVAPVEMVTIWEIEETTA